MGKCSSNLGRVKTEAEGTNFKFSFSLLFPIFFFFLTYCDQTKKHSEAEEI